jgi:hypothetical protein
MPKINIPNPGVYGDEEVVSVYLVAKHFLHDAAVGHRKLCRGLWSTHLHERDTTSTMAMI